MKNKDRFAKKYNALIEEYKSLREELMRRQNARQLILGVTIIAIGSMLGLILREGAFLEQDLKQGTDCYIFALITFAILIIIAALVLTIQHTQQIDTIGAYIRKFIEPKTELGWETRWMRYRELKKSNPKAGGLPLGTSKPLAVYYGLLTISIYLATFVTGLCSNRLFFIYISILTVFSLICSYDLYKRKTKGWKINWDMLDDER